MSIEKLEFNLPAVYTIGPKNDSAALYKYAKLLTTDDKNRDELVIGIVEGETRVICASLTMEEIFKDRKLFKDSMLTNINAELDQFGMTIYNANVKELQDSPGSEYFKYLRLKSQEGAINKAKVDVAKARMLGNVGEKEKEGETRKETIKIEAETIIFEQEKNIHICKALSEVQVVDAQYETSVSLANIEAAKRAQMRDEEMNQIVEAQKAKVAEENERAEKISKVNVLAEKIQAMADAEYYQLTKNADAELYQNLKTAEAELKIFQAQSSGIKKLQTAFKGDNKATLNYIMMEQGLHAEMARIHSKAIEGLKPKITVWNGDETGGPGLNSMIKSLPPLLTTIKDQTGVEPPTWMAKMPK